MEQVEREPEQDAPVDYEPPQVTPLGSVEEMTSTASPVDGVSDRRLKEEIRPVRGALERLRRLGGC